MKVNLKKRILSLILAAAMVVGMLPNLAMNVYATEGIEAGGQTAEAGISAASLDTSDLVFDVSNPAGYVTISFEDHGIRPENADIDNVELYGTALGTIIEPTEVPFVEGESIADVTVRLLDTMELAYESTESESGFYLASIGGFEMNENYYEYFGEFDAGEQSGWCVRLNDWHINQGASAFEVEEGDTVKWMYTCQYGADIGVDYSTKSAEIKEVNFTEEYGTLSYDEETDTYNYEVPENINAVAFSLELENYASQITVTVDGKEANYRPDKEIAVTGESKIVISSLLEYMDPADNNKVTEYTDTMTIQFVPEKNEAPTLKAEFAETKSKTYVYGNSYVYVYMDEIFEDADGDELTYEATLNGEKVDIAYNSWSKRYYIQFATKPAVHEYKIVASDGKAESEVFTAKCIGTSAAITPATEDSPLIEKFDNAGTKYYYYIYDSAENNTFSLDYTLDVNEELETEWYSQNPSVLSINEEGTVTVNPVTNRTEVMAAVTGGKDEWNSLIYLGTMYIYLLPELPAVEDIKVELPEHADRVVTTTVSNAFSGWYSGEFNYEIEDPTIADIATSGSYGISITPKALGTTTVTATFKSDESIKCTFDVTVTGRSLQIKDQPGVDSVIFEDGKTVQLEILGAEESETFTWTSSDEEIAAVDATGLVTVKKPGTTYITAVSSESTDEAPLKASMYLQIKEKDKVYLEDLALTQYSYFGHISAKAGFNSATLDYDWDLQENRYTYSTLQFTPYFDGETLNAVLHYQVKGGEYQTMELTDAAAVSINNGLNPGENVVKIEVSPKDDADNVTTYTFHIFRPYNPSNTINRMNVYPNGETALAYPKYKDNNEGTLFQYDAATGEIKTGWGGRLATGWSSSCSDYKVFVYGARTSSVTVYPTFAYTDQRVMIYVNGEEFEEAVTNWESKLITLSKEEITEIKFHVNSEKYHAEKLAAGVEDPFAEPEKVYTIYVENVTPLGIDAKILSAELANGDFYLPGFKENSYTISALIPADENSTEMTFTVPDGIDVYSGTVSDANKLTASNQDENGNNIYTTALTITGTNATAYSTTNIILQVTDVETGEMGNTQYAFTLYRRGTKDVYPDSIEDYLCIGSQYTNAGSYGTMPERTLKSGGGVLSLGNFGGYIVYKYDKPIENSENNPYGVDFVIYGNSFGNGAHEPGYVQVSRDGKTWYTLAGSDHFDDHVDWDYTMTYTNNNGKSAWTNSDGESGEIYNYPAASLYPYFDWTEVLEESMTVSGLKMNSTAKDSYGSAAAVLPDFGYADVNSNGTITGNAVNPYDYTGSLKSGGDQFDLAWAVNEEGMPVELDSISYIRVATASSIYAGAIGEKSTEITAVNRVTNAAEGSVGKTAAPESIKVNGAEIILTEQSNVYTAEYESGELKVDVEVPEGTHVYINDTYGAGRTYTDAPEKGIVRVIVQEGEKAPYIVYVTLKPHEHEYSENWVTDDSQHWKECECGERAESADHIFEWMTDKEPTETEAGMKHEECNICHVKRNENTEIPIIIPEVPEINKVIRIAGIDRYETGYEVADEYKTKLDVDKFEAVVVATGENFADALSGSYLAVVKNAPILLTNGKDDNIAMLHDYIKVNVKEGGTVYILGGDAAVPKTVESIEGYTIKRLSGPTRYDTNIKILEEAGIEGDELIVATGKTFADSLSASAVKKPILLVEPGEKLTESQKAIAATMNTIYIVGGEGAVDAAIAEELAAYATVERVYGASRYETSVKVAETFFGDVDEAVVASGKKKNFPDGLCGGPLAAAMNVPLILTATDETGATANYVAANDIESGYVLGGTAALSSEAVVEVFALENADEIISK